MIEHLVKFDAMPDISSFGITFGDDAADYNWRAGSPALSGTFDVDGQNIEIITVLIIYKEAVHDDDGAELEPRQTATGLWALLRYHRPILEWTGSPHLIAITSAELASQGPDTPFIVYLKDGIDIEALHATVWPVFAGHEYQFGDHITMEHVISHNGDEA